MLIFILIRSIKIICIPIMGWGHWPRRHVYLHNVTVTSLPAAKLGGLLLLIVFYQFLTCIALDDIALWFSVMLVRRANAVEEKINCDVLFYSQRNQSIHVTNGMTVMSFSANLLQKISVTIDCLCQIMSNSKLSHQF